LLRNYLTNHLQTVCVNGECGSFLPVSVGVPQGSVLRTLLFLIYNDIGFLPLWGSVRLFADDKAIFYPCAEVTELVESVQADLTRLKRYFTANKLTLSADKTSYLVFRALNKKLPDMPPLFYGISLIKR
jgi:ribonucleases P/MRP protein subunit RPP40